MVHDDRQLIDRVELLHERHGTDAIAEQYIDGRELYVGIIGNRRLQTLPVWEPVWTSCPHRRRGSQRRA